MELDKRIIRQVWEKGRGTRNRPSDEWREDECGAWICREQYGRETEFGWKIVNVSLDKPESVEDLRPFHWANSFNRSTRQANCKVTADRRAIPPTASIDEPVNREL